MSVKVHRIKMRENYIVAAAGFMHLVEEVALILF